MSSNSTELIISIRAESFPELLRMVNKLKADLDVSGSALTNVTLQTDTEATGKVVGKRGKKADAEKDTEATTTTTNVQTPDHTSTVNAVQDLSADDARKMGIEEMQVYFGKNPNAMPDIKRLQTKYGVKMFQDISADQAHAFLADVKLLASGSAQAA